MGNPQIKTEIKQEDGAGGINSQTLKDVLMAPSTTGNTPNTLSNVQTSSITSVSTTSTVFTSTTTTKDIKQEIKQEVEIKTEPEIKQEPCSEGGKQVVYFYSRVSKKVILYLPSSRTLHSVQYRVSTLQCQIPVY